MIPIPKQLTSWRIDDGVYAGRRAILRRDAEADPAWHIELLSRESPSQSWDIWCDDFDQLCSWLRSSELKFPGLRPDGELVLDDWTLWPEGGRLATAGVGSETRQAAVFAGKDPYAWRIFLDDGTMATVEGEPDPRALFGADASMAFDQSGSPLQCEAVRNYYKKGEGLIERLRNMVRRK